MGEVSTIGLDIGKSVFQVHGVDVAGAVVIRKRISRLKLLEFFANLPSCLVGIEACPSAHHWGRELLALGHTTKPLRREPCEPCSVELTGLIHEESVGIIPHLRRKIATPFVPCWVRRPSLKRGRRQGHRSRTFDDGARDAVLARELAD